MRTNVFEFSSLAGPDIPDDKFRLERIQLTMAACLLMSANAKLPPEDAVGDVLQVYQYVSGALEKIKAESPE